MQIRRPIFLFIAVMVVLIALALWHEKRKSVEMPPTAAVETNVASPITAAVPSAPVRTNSPVAQTAKSVPTPPMESKEQQMREGLAVLNDVDIEFYGRLEDQF